MESESAPSRRPSILKPNADPADFAALRDATETLEAIYHFQTGDSAPNDEDADRLIQQEARVKVLMAQVFEDCTEIGPPAPIFKGNLPDGGLVWACGHDPQHLYDFQTGELIP